MPYLKIYLVIIRSQIEYDEADLGVAENWPCLAETHEESLNVKIINIDCYKSNYKYKSNVECSHPIYYRPVRWITRAPREVFPYTNLLRIFDTYCWIGIVISMVAVSIFLKVAAKVGSYYGLETEDYEDFFIPFR